MFQLRLQEIVKLDFRGRRESDILFKLTFTSLGGLYQWAPYCSDNIRTRTLGKIYLVMISRAVVKSSIDEH